MATPGLGIGGHEGSRGANAHSPSSGRMRGWPSVTKDEPRAIWQNPTFHPLKQLPDTSTESIFRWAWKAPGFPGRGRATEPESGPVRCPGAESTARRPLRPVPCRWRPETHFGGPRPAALCAASPAGPGPAGQWRWSRSGPGTPRGWRPRPASLPLPALSLAPASRRRPAPGSRPSPGAGPRQARPAWRRAPCVPVAGPAREGAGVGGTPARTGRRGRYLAIAAAALQEAVGWSRVRGLSGLASPPAA